VRILHPGEGIGNLDVQRTGGAETPVTSIVIPLNAPDKVTTNITVPAPGPQGFWRVRSIR
jgi:hypothetical protein